MYVALQLLMLVAGALLLARGVRSGRKPIVAAGALLLLAGLGFSPILWLWAEMLWFESLGHSARFWTELWSRVGFGAAGGVLSAGLAAAVTAGFGGDVRRLRRGTVAAAGFAGAAWGASSWDTLLKLAYQAPTDVTDPIFGKATAFYLFTLPAADGIQALLVTVALIALAGGVVGALAGTAPGAGVGGTRFGLRDGAARRLYPAAALLAVAAALGLVLARYHLLFSTLGVVTGPGWTDVHVRLPGYAVLAAVALAAALAFAVPAIRDRLEALAQRRGVTPPAKPIAVMGGGAAALLAAGVLLLGLLPGLSQWLLVQPNEITWESEYIAHNIEFTRRGFDLLDIEEREFPLQYAFSPATLADNRQLFDNVRLWDWRALDAVYQQFQEIRLYYEFRDVDIDRYHFGGEYRQVMVSARELDTRNLPPESQTFVNERFKYTHGYGVTLSGVSEFTDEGLPDLLVKDLPPKSRHPALEVTQPGLYYGELTREHVIVNSEEEEFDYPSGDQNVYTRYSGRGGVRLSSLWRKFLLGSRFDGTRFFLSGYPTAESRVLFHRDIRERVATLAPFLRLDQDPYVVIAEGRLYWILDAYTTSDSYPYSSPFRDAEWIGVDGASQLQRHRSDLDGASYVRNSVKAVVDAYEGTVDLYVFEPEDPIIRTWRAIFPGLLKDREEMPASLRAHARYPADMLLAQGLIYSRYHMTDPAVFYNQEDLWTRATEKYYGDVQAVEPYYIMWEPPGSDEAEFVLMLPFTPKERQVLIGWIAGLCDGDDYGRFLAYKFPKEERILGPQQVETKIDQDPVLSERLTLWDQRGSRVIRGNVLAIPVEDTLVYVEPIYLQAETAAYPELRLVVVMHGDSLSYAPTFDAALQGLLEKGAPGLSGARGDRPEVAAAVRRAREAFDRYLDRLGDRRFDEASLALADLQAALEALDDGSTGEDAAER